MPSGTLVARLRARQDAGVQAMRDAMVAQVPGFAALSASGKVDLLGELHHSRHLVLESSVAGEPIPETELDFFRDIGLARGRGMFPIADIWAGSKAAQMAGMQELFSLAEAKDHPEMLQLLAYGAREHPRIMQAIELSHAAARGQVGDHSQARKLLVSHLVQGVPAAGVADAAGVVLPKGYLVLLCRAQRRASGDPAVPAIPAGVLERTLASVPGALWRGDPLKSRLLILLPADGAGAEATAVRTVAADVISALADAVGERLYTAEAYGATLEAVPEALHEAEQAITLVAAMPDAKGRPYRTDELLVELAVARQPDLRQRLTGLLAPLQEGTDLRRTLEVLFDSDLDRERTTKALYIHRRTLTYRIRRIRELTGIDPTNAHGIQLLRTALTATRLPAATRPQSPAVNGGLTPHQ